MKRWLVFFLLTSAQAFAIGPFRLPWVNGPTPEAVYSSADHPHGIFLINALWTGCFWCESLEGKTQRLAREYAEEERVQILEISDRDTDKTLATWVEKLKPLCPLLKDSASFLKSSFNILMYPTTIILDSRGAIRYRREGDWDETQESEVRAVLNQLLQETHSAGKAPFTVFARSSARPLPQ